MRIYPARIWIALLVVLAGWPVAALADSLLWEIGRADNSAAEFALAPSGFPNFQQDAFYCVGRSAPETDWPYCHPGPQDRWAGGRAHTFSIFFALEGPPSGACKLELDLLDTHSTGAPRLEININGREERSFRLPQGGGDASIHGDVSFAKEHVISVPIKAEWLQAGTNLITLSTLQGSWLLYDWIGLTAPEDTKLASIDSQTAITGVETLPILLRREKSPAQCVRVSVLHLGEGRDARLRIEGGEELVLDTMREGIQTVDVTLPPVQAPQARLLSLLVDGQVAEERSVDLAPVRPWELYLLHHTHLDIGYTHVQTEVMERQWEHLEKGIELARATQDYPEDARFKWLPEGLWAIDGYLAQASDAQKAAFFEAVRKGWVGLDALYGNELTALCRPEELLELTGYARRLARDHALKIDSAMITDVPGYSWGIVPVLAQSGVRYFSIGPNRGHRIGFTLSQWGDKPFYWVSPSGLERVLCWVAAEGYSWFHAGPIREERKLFEYLEKLEGEDYPYDLAHLRYSIGGDNGPPDDRLSDFVRAWNEKYAYPRLVVATTSEFFEDFEAKYGSTLPEVRGDFTPYWEDGAASSARETGINRDSADRLVQANALWALCRPPSEYPAERVEKAWREIILYDEHTWGAHNSISEPESDFALAQWEIKKTFAIEGQAQTESLLSDAVQPRRSAEETISAVEVFNTCSWPRTDLVTVPAGWKLAGDRVLHDSGTAISSQRLSTGELVFVARDVPPFGSAVYRLAAAAPAENGAAAAQGNTISNGLVSLGVDPQSGAIVRFAATGIAENLVDTSVEAGLNALVYVEGRDPVNRKTNGPVRITVLEPGPVVAVLRIESDAPGCRSFSREVRVVDGLPSALVTTCVDRENVYDKDAVHLAFPFQVPGGTIHMDTPWATVEAEKDQLAGSCKNYMTVQRWVDVSNAECGVVWTPLDAPLIEIGKLTNDPTVVGWRETIEPSTLLYSYAMNNYWETNYKASQEGITSFRFALQPHAGGFDAAAATRFGMAQSMPLVSVPVQENATASPPLFAVDAEDVVVTQLKPSDDGAGWMVRLLSLGQENRSVSPVWNGPKAEIYLSDVNEVRHAPAGGAITVPAKDMVTLRIEP